LVLAKARMVSARKIHRAVTLADASLLVHSCRQYMHDLKVNWAAVITLAIRLPILSCQLNKYVHISVHFLSSMPFMCTQSSVCPS